MRVLFMGTSEFAIPALMQLISHNFDIIGVVTQPDRPSGRGKKLNPPPIKKYALESNIHVLQPDKVRKPKFISKLKQLAPDVIVVAAFGQILPQTVLDIPPCGVINIHPSLLPKYRGAAPIQWTLINGEVETGVSLMLLDAGEDTGDIICMEHIPIKLDDTLETLDKKLADIGAKLLVDVLHNLKNGHPPPATPQAHELATHAPRLSKNIGHIKWNESAETIHNLIRGTAGWPGAYTYFNDGILLKLIHAQPHDEKSVKIDNIEMKQPGTLGITSDRQMFVKTGEGVIQLLKVQPATKKVMAANDFVNGYQLKTGDCFSNS
ncbi:MAG: methionyl-tRNA formyltransferase [Candidatus Poribacteria bacterium]|nr:methionyl-tRNA formyltransferase [Candidatus Poribacteria bacterium]